MALRRWLRPSLAWVLAGAALLLMTGVHAGGPPYTEGNPTYVVDSINDNGDDDLGDYSNLGADKRGTCADADGNCTLRAAIEQSRHDWSVGTNLGIRYIAFDSSLEGKIALGSSLTLDFPVVIIGEQAQDAVRIDGSAIPAAGSCFIIDPGSGDEVALHGLHIHECAGSAIEVRSGEGQIGDPDHGGNWITNATSHDIHIDATTLGFSDEDVWRIYNNHIGFYPNGTNATNGGHGIFIDSYPEPDGGDESNIWIGDLALGTGNFIGANGGDGIHIQTSNDVRIRGNHIGVDGSEDNHANAGWGIFLSETSRTVIGAPHGLFHKGSPAWDHPLATDVGDTNGANAIWFNAAGGVRVDHNPGFKENYVRANSIHENGGSGIELDPDNGAPPWKDVRAPVLRSASSVTGKVLMNLTGGPAEQEEVIFDFYVGDECGQGRVWIGGVEIDLDDDGEIPFIREEVTLTKSLLAPWKYITATATYENGTSAFGGKLGSACFTISHGTTTTTTTTTTTRTSTTRTTTTTTTTSPTTTSTLTRTPNPAEFPGVDSDGDGLSDAFERAFGTRPDRADTDGDGFDDLVELALETDPLSAASRPQVQVEEPPEEDDETPSPGLGILAIMLLGALAWTRRRL